jgi:hypothetical protein
MRMDANPERQSKRPADRDARQPKASHRKPAVDTASGSMAAALSKALRK